MLRGCVRRGVGPRRMSRGGGIVDGAPAPWELSLHPLDRFLSAEERPGEVDAQHSAPLVVSQVFHRNGWSVPAGVIEEKVQPAEGFIYAGEQGLNGIGLADVGGY